MVDFSQQFWDNEEIELADFSEEDAKDQTEDELYDLHRSYFYTSSQTTFSQWNLNFYEMIAPDHFYQEVYIQVPHTPPDNLSKRNTPPL